MRSRQRRRCLRGSVHHQLRLARLPEPLRKTYRPLSEAETTRLTALYRDARDTQKLDFNGAIGVLIEGMLQSPAFL